ncbi:MAG: single-stranded-DNA-specific exonuclease RecJ [Acidobacteriota bacterium]|nr:single-stranded-DNA-specific exonuclease RecJ [Acidobacteriota bacterium]MDH3525309.1 single-stranded-DNA-specific exonuclease RecJ [Acidobacteriota bacterium]
MSVRWQRAPLPAGATPLAAGGLPDWLAAMLARRGIQTAAAAEAFLEPSLADLHDPARLPDLEAALERLLRARAAGEKVAVVGDYDVDGVTASAQLLAVLRACGVAAEAVLPHRHKEGYGFQPVHAERARALGCALVVTADCGSTSHAAVERAGELGLDVIVTDHHLTAGDLPAGTLEINPARADAEYPYRHLCASGIAFKLASAFAARCERPVRTESLLRMACLGTIADLVPLTGENRTIAALGLRALPETPSPGLQALMAGAGVGRPVTAEDVGYRLGPRINAAGRMDAADTALDLLLSRDRRAAREAAARLEEWNRERRTAQARTTAAAVERWQGDGELPAILVGWDPDWHAGVVGISAGQVARHYHRPALLLQVRGELAKGSGRSIPGIDLHAFLHRWGDRLERFGGHEQAVGLTVTLASLPLLAAEWAAAAGAEWPPEALERVHEYEWEFAPDALGRELEAALRRLEPFGMGNRRPLLRTGPLALLAAPRLFGEGHLKGTVRTPGGRLLAILGWGWAARAAELERPFEALVHLEHDKYLDAPVLRLRDVRPPAAASA